jgi:hypothetical protein
MKNILFSALMTTIALGGATVSQGEAKASSKVTRTAGIYYDLSNQYATIDCTGDVTDCSELFEFLHDTRTGTSPDNYQCTNLQPVIGALND